MLRLLALASLVAATVAWQLQAGPYMPLPSFANGCRPSDSSAAGAATKAAYDSTERLLYVIGTEADVLHIVSMEDPRNPELKRTWEFNYITDGFPDSIAVCRRAGATTGYLSIGFEARDLNEVGHINIYPLKLNTDVSINGDLVASDRISLEGRDPRSHAWDSTCTRLVMVAEGDPFEVGDVFEDPAADVEVITEAFGNWDKLTININEADLEAANVRYVFDRCDLGSSSDWVSTRKQDLEPKKVIALNDRAIILFQENNALGRLWFSNSSLEYADLGYLDRSQQRTGLDSADDGSISVVQRKIQALYQPNDIVYFELNGARYFATANQGSIRRYNKTSCKFDEDIAGSAWISDPDHSFSSQNLTSTESQTLTSEMADNGQLGRLKFSHLKRPYDGYNVISGQQNWMTTFGTRSFSIWSEDTLSQIYDSGDAFESYFATANDRHRSMFNAYFAFPNNAQSFSRDISSIELGPSPSNIALADKGDTKVLAIANGEVGGLYLASVQDIPVSGITVTQEQYVRRGDPGQTWAAGFQATGSGTCTTDGAGQRVDNDLPQAVLGEPLITDLLYFEEAGESIFLAVSNGAGALSFYYLSE